MKFKYLELQNYIGIYNGVGLNNIKIDFTKCRSNKILIKGLNGSGKSTIYNALSPHADSNDNFISGVEARKNLCIINDGVEYTIRYIHGVDSNGQRLTSKGYISKCINGQDAELNPNGNISSCKDIIYNEFNLDANFIALSQLSTEDRGLAYKIPSARKKFVTNIIDVLDTYNNINKIISKKASIFKSTINSLTYKIDSIGDEMALQLNLKSVEDRINSFNLTRQSIVEDIAMHKVKADEINSILQQNNYDSICIELNELSKNIKSLESMVNRDLKNLEVDDIKIIPDIFKQVCERIIILENTIESDRTKIPVLLAERESEYNKLQDKNERLNALQSEYNYMDIKKATEEARRIISEYDIIFNEMGLRNIDLITKEDFDTAMESLLYLKDMASTLVLEYEHDRLLEVYNNMPLIKKSISDMPKIRMDLESLRKKSMEIQKELVIMESKRSIANELLNRPKECKIDSCYFIKSALEANEKYPEPLYKSLSIELEKINNEIEVMQIGIENAELNSNIVIKMENIQRELNSKIKFISKLPISPTFKDDFIIRAINGDSFADIDKLYKYIDCGNFIEEYKVAKTNLHNFEVEYKIFKSKNDVIENIISDIEELTIKTDDLANQIEIINNIINDNEKELYSIKIAKDKLATLIDRINNDLNPSINREQELINIKQSLEGNVSMLQSIQNIINDKYNSLGSLDNEIKNASDERDKLKHASVLLQEYKTELEVYNNKYNKIEKIKYYSSPSTGIQTLFMELYMNKTINIANNLLSLLFNGEFVLQPFIIDANEFRIPCVGNGLMHDDISSMSTAQKCMISMILSFSLLYQSSTKYNIIKLDEIDGGLDNINRPYFTDLLDQLMNMLKCEQSFIISHNIELDDSSCDVILLKDNPYNSLISARANVIFKAV